MFWHNREHQTVIRIIKNIIMVVPCKAQILIVVYICQPISFLFQMDGFQRHFDSQIISYGKQMIVNLVCFHLFFLKK